MFKHRVLSSIVLATAAFGSAHAAPVASTSASSFAGAQEVTAAFSLTAHPHVQDSAFIPHVAITQSGRASAGNDYYRFSHLGGTVHLDVDGASFDIEIGLWNAAGTLIAFNDDNGSDPGSNSWLNSAIFNLNLTAGDYVVGVCRFNCWFDDNGVIDGEFVPQGGSYLLNISANGGTVPEPATAGLVLLAALGAAATRRKANKA